MASLRLSSVDILRESVGGLVEQMGSALGHRLMLLELREKRASKEHIFILQRDCSVLSSMPGYADGLQRGNLIFW